jgi:hypothetical protein
VTPLERYAALLARAGRTAVPALSRRLALSRRAAAEAFATSAGLVLAGLSRHQSRRAGDAGAAVLEKYARPADLDSPRIAVEAHVDRPRLDVRLGGLWGDAGEKAVRWLVARTGAGEAALARALAASAPLALGALARAAPPGDLVRVLAGVPSDPLDDPDRLLGPGPCSHAYRRVRRGARPLLARLVGR